MSLLRSAYDAVKGKFGKDKKPDYSKTEDIAALMESSRDMNDWHNNCRILKEATGGGGYPEAFYGAVVMSGLKERKFREFEQRKLEP